MWHFFSKLGKTAEDLSLSEGFQWHLLPEKDVPEKQPAGVHHQSYEWVNQRAIQEVVQDALWDDWQVEQPAVLEANRRFLQLLEEKDRKEQRAGRTEDDQDERRQNPERRRGELSTASIGSAGTGEAFITFVLWYMGGDEGSHRHQSKSKDEAQGEVDEGRATQEHS